MQTKVLKMAATTYGWMVGWPDGWAGCQLAGVSVGENRSMFHGNHSGALFAMLRFYFRCNNRIRRKTPKKKCQQNRAAQILSKQKTSAKEGGKKRLSAFHFSLRAIVK